MADGESDIGMKMKRSHILFRFRVWSCMKGVRTRSLTHSQLSCDKLHEIQLNLWIGISPFGRWVRGAILASGMRVCVCVCMLIAHKYTAVDTVIRRWQALCARNETNAMRGLACDGKKSYNHHHHNNGVRIICK